GTRGQLSCARLESVARAPGNGKARFSFFEAWVVQDPDRSGRQRVRGASGVAAHISGDGPEVHPHRRAGYPRRPEWCRAAPRAARQLTTKRTKTYQGEKNVSL